MAESPNETSTPTDDETTIEISPDIKLPLRPSQQLDLLRQQQLATGKIVRRLETLVTPLPGQLEELKTRLDSLDLNGEGPKLKGMVRDWDQAGPGLKSLGMREIARELRRARWTRRLKPITEQRHLIAGFVGALISAAAYFVVNHAGPALVGFLTAPFRH